MNNEQASNKQRQNSVSNIDIKRVLFPETPVAVLEHRETPTLIGDTIRQFILWRKANSLSPAVSDTFNLVYDDPNNIPADEYRLDLCVSLKLKTIEKVTAKVIPKVKRNDVGVITKVIPGGYCAMFRHFGAEEGMRAAIDYLYQHWLNENNEQPGQFPLFFHRVNFFPDVAEHEMITDVYLPLQ